MQVKVYVPKIIEVPSEYLPALAKHAPTAWAIAQRKFPPPEGTSCARPSRTVCSESSIR